MAGLSSNGTPSEILETRKGKVALRLISRRERTAFSVRHKEAGDDPVKRDEAFAYLVAVALCRTPEEGGGRIYGEGHESEALDMDQDVFDVIADRVTELNLPPLKEEPGKATGATPIAPSQPS